MDRNQSQGIEHRSAMRVGWLGAFELVLRASGRQRRGSRTDEADRRAIHADAVLRQPTDGVRSQQARQEGQPQARATADAADGPGSHLPEASTVGSSSRPPDLSLPAAGLQSRSKRKNERYQRN